MSGDAYTPRTRWFWFTVGWLVSFVFFQVAPNGLWGLFGGF